MSNNFNEEKMNSKNKSWFRNNFKTYYFNETNSQIYNENTIIIDDYSIWLIDNVNLFILMPVSLLITISNLIGLVIFQNIKIFTNSRCRNIFYIKLKAFLLISFMYSLLMILIFVINTPTYFSQISSYLMLRSIFKCQLINYLTNSLNLFADSIVILLLYDVITQFYHKYSKLTYRGSFVILICFLISSFMINLICLFESENIDTTDKFDSEINQQRPMCFKLDMMQYDLVSLCLKDGLMFIIELALGYKCIRLIRNNLEIKLRNESFSINETTSVNIVPELTSTFLRTIKNKRRLSIVNKNSKFKIAKLVLLISFISILMHILTIMFYFLTQELNEPFLYQFICIFSLARYLFNFILYESFLDSFKLKYCFCCCCFLTQKDRNRLRNPRNRNVRNQTAYKIEFSDDEEINHSLIVAYDDRFTIKSTKKSNNLKENSTNSNNNYRNKSIYRRNLYHEYSSSSRRSQSRTNSSYVQPSSTRSSRLNRS